MTRFQHGLYLSGELDVTLHGGSVSRRKWTATRWTCRWAWSGISESGLHRLPALENKRTAHQPDHDPEYAIDIHHDPATGQGNDCS